MAMSPQTSRELRYDDPKLTSADVISVVVPAYNEEESLQPLYEELSEALGKLGLQYEIIFVNDGSTDGTHPAALRICNADSHVKCIRLRRNFGKAEALDAGFKEAKGTIIFTMDADLQDDPAEIPNFLAKLEEGYDLVSGWKFHRLDPIGKTLPSKLFNMVASATTGVKLHDFNCGFKAYRREVLEHLNVYGELHRYIPALANGNGFAVGEIKVHHRQRKFGKTKYGMARFTRGLLDLLTVLFITRYTKKPLHLFGSLGLALLGMGVVINGYLAVLWFMGYAIGHRPLLTLGVLLMILGIQSISTGLLGEMIVHVQHKDDHCVASKTHNDGKTE